MRKLVLSVFMTLVWTGIQAKDLNDYDYVVTNTTTYYCEEINMGVTTTKVKLNTGEPLLIKNNDILAFKKKGKIFEKMPLYCHNKYIGRSDYMELIAYKMGHKLYKYTCMDGDMNIASVNNPAETCCCRLYVFRNGEFHLELDETNYSTVLGFFGKTIKMNS
jgi:hypothetical protein